MKANCRITVLGESSPETDKLLSLLQSRGYQTSMRPLANKLEYRAYIDNTADLIIIVMDEDTKLFITGLRSCLNKSQLPILLALNPGSKGYNPSLRSQCISAGANDFIEFPLEPSIALMRVENLLATKSTHQQNHLKQLNLEQKVKTRTAELRVLVENGLMMSAERDRNKLLQHILVSGKQLLHCDAGTIYLVTENNTLNFAMRTKQDVLPIQEIPLYDQDTGRANEAYVSTYTALHNKPVLIDDVYKEKRFDLSGTKAFDVATNRKTLSMLSVPMAPRNGEVIGVLQFMNAIDAVTGELIPFAPDIVDLVVALASQAAVALDNLHLVEAQAKLMESMIRVIATAIDAKSPYTGRHCERVPELAFMLAEAACNQTTGPLAEFNFNTEEEWQEFRIGAWLHDCGKVTTPEYVIDKSTKLETIYNRIHEIRMRFEVMLRDTEISCLQAKLAGASAEDAESLLEKRKIELQQDFAFIAECNLGSETMDNSRITKVLQIAKQTWVRYFDDRLGLSLEETERHVNSPAPALPAVEHLLSDKVSHIIERPLELGVNEDFGFKIDIPKYLYNYGEVYNLCIRRGTLTAEERYKINEHMTQGIMMLERMNFPKSLRRVPEYAGTHHETLDGTGYPRRLTANELSIPSRIMAIVDIFEALTAADRPYKKPKLLSEALSILHTMKTEGRIDGVLFDLFLTSGIYIRFARQYLEPSQIDEIDIQHYIS